eukprot:12429854-Karenia_brevis.AAC.1
MDVEMTTPQDKMPDEINGIPMERRTLVIPNAAKVADDRAREIGAHEILVPAPIPDLEQGNAATPWRP